MLLVRKLCKALGPLILQILRHSAGSSCAWESIPHSAISLWSKQNWTVINVKQCLHREIDLNENSTGAFQGLLSKFIQVLNKQKLQHASDTFLYCTTKLWTCLYLQHFQQHQADLSMLSSFAQSLECRIMNY